MPKNAGKPSSIENAPLLKKLTPVVRAELLNHAVEHRVGAGAVLFQQGDPPNFQHVVLSGSVQLIARSAEREVLIEVVHAPELVVPAAVVMNSPYLVEARTPEPSRILLIHGAAFRAAAAGDSALAAEVTASLCRYRAFPAHWCGCESRI